jgi:predicted DNA-binding transcriptional regulator
MRISDKNKLTPGQAEVMGIIYVLYREGEIPTIAEIAEELGIMKCTVCVHVNNLKKKGFLRGNGIKLGRKALRKIFHGQES